VKKITKQEVFTICAVFLFLLGIYYLSFSGFPVSDDEQMFSAVSQSISNGNGLEAPQLYGNNRLLGEYTGSGLLPVYIGAALLRGISNTGFGHVQALYLLSPMYTALTAALLMLIVTWHGFSLRTAAIIGLLFGLSTIAWPYSQTYFREPLAMLLLTAAWLCFLFGLDQETRPVWRTVFLIIGLASLIGAMITKILLMAAVPAFLWLFWEKRDKFSWKKALLGVVVLLAVGGLFSLLMPDSRLSLGFFERFWRFRREFPYQEIPRALLEMLLTPGRGLLLYSPVLFLIPVGLVKRGPEQRRMVVFSLLAAAGLMLAQATGYGAEWWGITWGTRFLLPVLPLLIVGLAPTVDLVLDAPQVWLRLVLWSLSALGILIQLSGVLLSNSAYTIDLYYTQLVPDIGDVLWSFKHAPLIAHWRLLLAGAELNLAGVRVFLVFPGGVVAIIAICALLIAWGAVVLSLVWRKREVRLKWWVTGLLVVGVVVLPVLMLTSYRYDPRYGADRGDVQNLVQVLEDEVQPGDVILVFPYLRTTWYYFMNFYRGDADWYSLPNTFPAGDLASTIALVNRLVSEHSRVWLVAETAEWELVPVFVEGYLTQFGELEAMAAFEQVDQNLQLRLLLYELEDRE
jgi:hypothetical protein